MQGYELIASLPEHLGQVCDDIRDVTVIRIGGRRARFRFLRLFPNLYFVAPGRRNGNRGNRHRPVLWTVCRPLSRVFGIAENAARELMRRSKFLAQAVGR